MEHQMTVKREGEFTYDIEWHNTFEEKLWRNSLS